MEENTEVVAKNATTSNSAEMRKVLEECRDYLYDVLSDAFRDAQVAEQNCNPDMTGYEREQRLHKVVSTALAAPPRNCDVGTAQEQGIRFKRFCDVRTNTWDGCRGCPVNTPGNEHTDCSLIWAQMPYEANEENGGAE